MRFPASVLLGSNRQGHTIDVKDDQGPLLSPPAGWADSLEGLGEVLQFKRAFMTLTIYKEGGRSIDAATHTTSEVQTDPVAVGSTDPGSLQFLQRKS